LLAFPFNLFAEQPIFDSLRTQLKKAESTTAQIEIEIKLAYNYLFINADSLRHYANSVIKKSKQTKDNIMLYEGYMQYAGLFHGFPEIINMDSSWYYLDLAYKTAEKESYTIGMAACVLQKGVSKIGTEDEAGAIDDLLNAKKLWIESGDSTEFSALADFYIAQIYELGGHYDKAIAVFDSIIHLDKVIKSDNYVRFLEIIGSTYQSAKDYNKSLEYYKKAHAAVMVIGDNYDKHRILMKLASVYHYLGNVDSTNYFYNKTILYADSCKDFNRMENDCVRLADICFDNKQYDEAEKFYLKSLGIVRTNHWNDLELYTLERISNFYQTTKDYSKALDFLQQYILLKEKMKIEKIGHIIDKALTDQELENKKNELFILKNEQAKRRNHFIIAFIIVSTLLFFLIWYIQAGLLTHFSKTKPAKNFTSPSQSLWNYIPPVIIPNHINSIVFGVLFTLLNVGVYLLFYKQHTHALSTAYWAIVSLILIYSSERLYYGYRAKRINQSLKTELLQQLASLAPFIAIITATAFLFKLIESTPEQYIYFALLITANFFIILSLRTLFQYRKRFGMLSENLVEEFNKILSERKNNPILQPLSNQITPATIAIDDNGKKINLNLQNLLYIVSDNVYQEFISIENDKITKILVRNTLNSIERSLQEFNFFMRCHRSYIVNTTKIKSIIRQSRQYYFVLENLDEKIPISRSVEENILEKFGKI
jgi:tetratricopeptide (TPR) repeat protein